MSAFNWSAIAFILAAIGLVVFMLVVPRLLGGRSQGSQKEEVFEAGVVGAGNARIRLSAKLKPAGAAYRRGCLRRLSDGAQFIAPRLSSYTKPIIKMVMNIAAAAKPSQPASRTETA